ncbi:MAG: hypothetical protein C0511_00025 [Hyphomicrobium sp.]|nr:hypothetical protein [Hyphomicrobium sp.]PPC84255.1 MAG: hypothetical protein CTY40_00025 [Hyphomicrobium sp.]
MATTTRVWLGPAAAATARETSSSSVGSSRVTFFNAGSVFSGGAESFGFGGYYGGHLRSK